MITDTPTADTRIGILWKLIFADDIAPMAETEEELKEKVGKWQRAMKGSNFEKKSTLKQLTK